MAAEKVEPAAENKHVKRTPILIGLALGVLLFALDQTVVGTSLPKVVADIGGFEHYAWVFTAYMLTSTVMIPISGKLSDLIGRRIVFLTGMITFLIGSVLCALSGEIGLFGLSPIMQLIVFRGIQGLGGGMIFPVALATIADLYAPSERGKVQGAMGGVWGLASVIGPFLGGWIVDNVDLFGVDSWRWVFLVNIPVGIVAVSFVVIFFPRMHAKGTDPIDYIGAALITATLVPVLLITVWGGADYGWLSWQILSMGAFSLVCAILFVFRENMAKDPVIPLSMFKKSVFSVSVVASFLMGMGMFGVIGFMPTFFQGVVGMSATYSGAILLPLTVTMVVGSILSGVMLKRFGYKIFAVSGSLVAAYGFFLLSRLGTDPPIWLAVVGMMVVGFGMGLTMQTFIVAVQNVIEKRIVGAATSTVTLFRSLGGTIGVTLLGTILNRRFESALDGKIPPEKLNPILNLPMINGQIDSLPQLLLIKPRPPFLDDATIEAIKTSFSSAISMLFIIATVLALLAFVVTIFLKSVPLKSSEEYHNGDNKSKMPPEEPAPVIEAI
jgi:EmrB/QacA subfamily drug resistance transporter